MKTASPPKVSREVSFRESLHLAAVASVMELLSGCTSIPVDQRADRRTEVDATDDDAIENLLDELEVGINGREKEPFEFVAFEDANADSEIGAAQGQ